MAGMNDQLLQEIFQSMEQYLLVVNQKQELTCSNRFTETLLTPSFKRNEAQPLANVLPQENLRQFESALELINSGTSRLEFSTFWEQTRWIIWKATPTSDNTSVVFTGRNATDRTTTCSDLIQTEADLRHELTTRFHASLLLRIQEDANNKPEDAVIVESNYAFAVLADSESAFLEGKHISELIRSNEIYSHLLDFCTNNNTKELISRDVYIEQTNRYYRCLSTSIKPNHILLLLNDITPIKAAEKALQISQDHFYSIFSHPRLNLLLLSDKGMILRTSRSFQHIIGYSQRDLYNKPILSLIHQKDKVIAKDALIRASHKSSDEIFEWQFIDKWNKSHFYQVFISHAEKNNDRCTLSCVLFDATEIKYYQSLVEQNSERFRLMFELNNAIQLLIDPETKIIIDANNAACQFYKYSRTELLGKSIFLLHKEKDSHHIFAGLQLDPKIKSYHFAHQTSQGEPRNVEVNISNIKTDKKNIYYAIIHDVTRRVEIEEALKESESRFRSLFSESPVAMCIFEKESARIIDVNNSFKNLLAHYRSNLIGKTCVDIFQKDITSFLCNIISGTQKIDAPKEFLLERGNEFPAIPVELVLNTIELHGVTNYLCTFHNLSVQKKTQEVLLASSKFEAASTLAGGVAHDINNLMAGILGNSELLRLDDMNWNEEQQEMLLSISRNAEKAGELAHQLLAFAKAGKNEITKIDVGLVVHSAVNSFSESAEKSIRYRMDLPPDLWTIKGDQAQISQLFIGLLKNSIEALEDSGKISIFAQNITINTDQTIQNNQISKGRYVMVTVTDNGIGMDQKTLDRCFEPFFSSRFSGRGLGLSAALGIVKNHGGTILIKSELHKGTSVSVFLPAEQTAKSSIFQIDLLNEAVDILLVDYDRIVRSSLRKHLEKSGFSVLQMASIDEIIDWLKINSNMAHFVVVDADQWEYQWEISIARLQNSFPSLEVLLIADKQVKHVAQATLQHPRTHFVDKSKWESLLLEQLSTLQNT